MESLFAGGGLEKDRHDCGCNGCEDGGKRLAKGIADLIKEAFSMLALLLLFTGLLHQLVVLPKLMVAFFKLDGQELKISSVE